VHEAVSEAAGHPQYAAIASRDHRADGHKGGRAPRRPPSLAAAKRQILQSKNGQAAYQLLAMELKALEQREQALLSRDRELAEMDLMLRDVREDVESAVAELERVRSETAERERQLEQARQDDAVLEDLLRACGERRVEAACQRLGWVEQ
jgi:hypothetical protein